MRTDWSRLKAVVLQSDDWGLCAWSPDEEGYRALSGTPAFRSAAGRVYGRSTLESAADVRALGEVLQSFRGADGRPPVWQANAVVAAPDYERLARDGPGTDELPLVALPDTPSRWARPGLWDEVRAAVAAGVWRPELHGLHHLPESAWLDALRRHDADARLALAHQSPVCEAVEASGEYDASEPAPARTRRLEQAVELFTSLFGRPPASLCPPDYRFDAHLVDDARRLGVEVLQGVPERGGTWLRVRRLLHLWRWPAETRPFAMPPRIAFEPRGEAAPRSPLGAARAHLMARAAWARGQPAVVSSHRHNYAHLDPAWSEAGRAALRDLLGRLCEDGATFVTDARVRELALGAECAR